MNITAFLILVILLFVLELLYFKVAIKFNIVDKPNQRSSHTGLTIRGGGIIFPLGILLYELYSGFAYPFFFIGLVIISTISFIDDIKPASNKLRLFFHLAAVALIFYQLNLFGMPIYWCLIAFVFIIGSINAINFMDGINGITGLYGLCTLSSLLYINAEVVHFIESDLIVVSIFSIVVFLFFNFRIKAKCFAGDVGSVSLAFIILFLLLELIIKTKDLSYLMLLLLYGLDTGTTILFRMIRKENIFEAHRSHFYQYWANERKISHLIVAAIYAVVQLIINSLLILIQPLSPLNIVNILMMSTVLFVLIRFYIQGRSELVKR